MSAATAPTSVDRRRIVNSTMWSAVESGGLSVLSFASLILYSRYLTASEFGLFAMLLAIIEMMTLIPSMAFHDALVQRARVRSIHFDSAFSASMALAVLLVISSWVVSPLLVGITKDPRAGTLFGIMSFSFIFAGLSSTIAARQRREMAFRNLATRSLAGRLGGALIGIGCAVAGAGVWSLVAQQLAMQALGSLVLWLTCAHRPRLRLHQAVIRDLGIFGLSSLGALFTNFAVKRLLILAAGFFLGTSVAGYINIAFRMVDTFWTLTVTAISQVSLPIFSKLQQDPDRLRRAYREAVGTACVLVYPAFIGLAAVAPEAVEILFGRKWLPAAPYVSMLGVLVVFQAPRLFIGPILTALGKPSLLLRGYIIGLVYLAVAIAVTRFSTPATVIMVWSGCELLYFAVFGQFFYRAAGVTRRQQIRFVAMPLVASLMMAAGVTACRWYLGTWALPWRTVVLVAVGGIVYLAAIYTLDRSKLHAAWKLVRSRGAATSTSEQLT